METIIEFTDNKALEAGKIAVNVRVSGSDPEKHVPEFGNSGGTGKISGTFVLDTKLIFVYRFIKLDSSSCSINCICCSSLP